jgi:hypothetical protein
MSLPAARDLQLHQTSHFAQSHFAPIWLIRSAFEVFRLILVMRYTTMTHTMAHGLAVAPTGRLNGNAPINAPITKQGAQQLAASNRVQLADGAAQLPPVRWGADNDQLDCLFGRTRQ